MTQKIDATSSDYQASRDYWLMVSTMLAGTQAMRKAGEAYLPRFEAETLKAYRVRLKTAKFTNIFGDIIDNLAARPFSKEIKVDKFANEAYLEDMDGMKNHVHKFTAAWFKEAMAKGISWVFVDYTKTNPTTLGADGVPRRKTLAEERTSGARPYAVKVKPEDVLAVYSAFINGVEKFVHVRFREVTVEVVNYEEVTVTRIREFNRAPIVDAEGDIMGYDKPTWTVWRQKSGANNKVSWEIEDTDVLSIEEIPLVPLIIGERDVGWHVIAAMQDAADLQMEYYEQENGVKNIKTLTAYPMLTASGVSPEMETVETEDSNGNKVTKKAPKKAPVGPRSVLYAPANEISGAIGQWAFIEPAGTSLTFLSGDLDKLEKALRELGRQPLTANSGNLTVVTTAFAAAKGNAAIQFWALDCKDSLETVLYYMNLWEKKSDETTVVIPLDFSLEVGEDKTFTNVATMRKDGDLSRKTYWKEAQRRKILSDDFDPDEEEKLLEDEQPGDATEEDNMDAATLDTDEEINPETGEPFTPEEKAAADAKKALDEEAQAA